MLTALPPGVLGRLFPWVTDQAMSRHFAEVRFLPEGAVPAGPLLVLANHSGWWDPFLVHRLNRRVFRRRFHVMMLEPELRKRSFFRRVGAFSWNRGDRAESREGLAYTAGLLRNPEHMVLIFPQGEIRSQHLSPVQVGSAPRWAARGAGPDLVTIFVSLLLDYGSLPRPSACVRWQVDPEGAASGDLGARFNAFLDQARAAQAGL